MTKLILKRHPPTRSDLKVGPGRKVKGTLENENTELQYPDSFLYPYHFANMLADLSTGGTLVLAHGNLVRTKEDAEATSVALNRAPLNVPHEVREAAHLEERGLGDLADKDYDRVQVACGIEGVLHSLFYAHDYRQLMIDAKIPGTDYGDTFEKFIQDTFDGLVELLRLYKRAEDIVVLHTHSLRGVAIQNVLHRIGYQSFREEGYGLASAILDRSGAISRELLDQTMFDPQSGYWWRETEVGEYMIMNVRRDGHEIHVTDKQPLSLGLHARYMVNLRKPLHDPGNPLEKFTADELAFFDEAREQLGLEPPTRELRVVEDLGLQGANGSETDNSGRPHYDGPDRRKDGRDTPPPA
jgi:hypothetical protein